MKLKTPFISFEKGKFAGSEIDEKKITLLSLTRGRYFFLELPFYFTLIALDPGRFNGQVPSQQRTTFAIKKKKTLKQHMTGIFWALF